jgi:hypothetical protein
VVTYATEMTCALFPDDFAVVLVGTPISISASISADIVGLLSSIACAPAWSTGAIDCSLPERRRLRWLMLRF